MPGARVLDLAALRAAAAAGITPCRLLAAHFETPKRLHEERYEPTHGPLQGEDVGPGAMSLTQSFGSFAHWHRHPHVMMTDGAFRRDGRFVAVPAHNVAVPAGAWQRAVLALFVRHGWLEEGAASAMVAAPHSGFGSRVGALDMIG